MEFYRCPNCKRKTITIHGNEAHCSGCTTVRIPSNVICYTRGYEDGFAYVGREFPEKGMTDTDVDYYEYGYQLGRKESF